MQVALMNGFKRMQGLSSERELYTFIDETRRKEVGGSQGIIGLRVTRALQSRGEGATSKTKNNESLSYRQVRVRDPLILSFQTMQRSCVFP